MSTPVIYIVGMPGSGKTTLAQKAAADLGWTQIDLDNLIEEQTQTTIAKLFAESEIRFRDAEETALRNMQVTSPTFISCGGGVVERAANREFLMNQQVIYLDCPLEVLWNRVKHDNNRPLLSAADLEKRKLNLIELYVRRQEWFKQVATLTIPVGDATLEEDTLVLEEAVNELLKAKNA
ncbi:shikimate kinase [Gleimia sp. 6138-11-ORH1]|uniref:shikimate kinase n=1 Tax=Gleimia sp. 6138-11-ORH1 TaxID=2973937 RepID=UPI0021688D5F|nr:shikimate kinase [Gleimia sp. 6138-11-ORH1]MCS4484383.1 shikimate kinase [Gleimia sp. 6138-11-ORH1]